MFKHSYLHINACSLSVSGNWSLVLSPVCHGEVSVAGFLFFMLLIYVFTCSAIQSLTNSNSHVFVSVFSSNFFFFLPFSQDGLKDLSRWMPLSVTDTIVLRSMWPLTPTRRKKRKRCETTLFLSSWKRESCLKPVGPLYFSVKMNHCRCGLKKKSSVLKTQRILINKSLCVRVYIIYCTLWISQYTDIHFNRDIKNHDYQYGTNTYVNYSAHI